MTPKDFDRLSAYIDDQLSPREKAALEARLERDAELRAALDELRLTVRALRALPSVKPPRSFTLTPALVGQGAGGRQPFFPALRLAAALSAIALVVVMAGDIAVTTGLLPGAPAAEPAAVALSARETPGPPAEPEADVRIEMLPPEDLPAPEQTGTVAAAEVEAFEATAQGAVGQGGVTAPEAETPSAAEMMVAATPETTATPSAERKAVPADTAEAPGAAELAPPADVTGEDTFAVTVAEAPPGLSTLRIVQVALAILTVMLGLGAWFTRRGG
jgi:hypothetical protein